MNDCSIVVPVYKELLNNYEYVSFARCCKILRNNYDIYLLTYKELNINSYIEIANKYNCKLKILNRNKEYFKDVWMYCVQMLDPILYSKFTNYKYMLIYHLDCYIFKDDLKYWINKDYDQCECIAIGGSANGKPHIWFNGEGLRKIKSVINCLEKNYEAANNLKINMMYMHLLKLLNSPLEKEWIMYKGGEDVFFTDHLSNYKITEDFFKFGWSVNVLNIIDCPSKYGIPTMIHNFLIGKQWVLDNIGDPDVNKESCINKEYE